MTGKEILRKRRHVIRDSEEKGEPDTSRHKEQSSNIHKADEEEGWTKAEVGIEIIASPLVHEVNDQVDGINSEATVKAITFPSYHQVNDELGRIKPEATTEPVIFPLQQKVNDDVHTTKSEATFPVHQEVIGEEGESKAEAQEATFALAAAAMSLAIVFGLMSINLENSPKGSTKLLWISCSFLAEGACLSSMGMMVLLYVFPRFHYRLVAIKFFRKVTVCLLLLLAIGGFRLLRTMHSDDGCVNHSKG